MRTGLRRGIVAVVATIAALAMVVPAEGARRRYATTTTASFVNRECGVFPCTDETDTFEGSIGSRKGACLRGRQVSVFLASNDSLLGTAVSSSAGTWIAESEDPTALSTTFQYYVVVAKKRTRRFICKAFVSPDMTGSDEPAP